VDAVSGSGGWSVLVLNIQILAGSPFGLQHSLFLVARQCEKHSKAFAVDFAAH
jgi:hypothetical protein